MKTLLTLLAVCGLLACQSLEGPCTYAGYCMSPEDCLGRATCLPGDCGAGCALGSVCCLDE